MINGIYRKITIVNPGWNTSISSSEKKRECTIDLNHSVGFDYNKIFIVLRLVRNNGISGNMILSNLANITQYIIYSGRSDNLGFLERVSCSKTSLTFTYINNNVLNIALYIDEIIYME